MSQTQSLIDRSFREKIILVGVSFGHVDLEATNSSLDELAQLVDTAGADVVATSVQRRDRPDPAYYVGRGKVDELVDMSKELDVDTVVFDDELTPAQQRNLTKILGRTAIDRTAVILDIFAQNARTPEGRAQVELAQLRYRLPFLRGLGSTLSQQAGGIGTRGPGETKLEVDRRRLLERVNRLERELKQLAGTRSTQRRARLRSGTKTVSIVGYTNAGKSTLLNALTDAGVLVEDRLFATLDPRIRKLKLPSGESILVSDTVGFIKKLPHQLVESFRSTLDVVSESDLLVHVVDASTPDPGSLISAVDLVLKEIGASELPQLVVWNKSDLLAPDDRERLEKMAPGSVFISASAKEGLSELLDAISSELRRTLATQELRIPYDRSDLIAKAHSGEVLWENATDFGLEMVVRADPTMRAKLSEFELAPGSVGVGQA